MESKMDYRTLLKICRIYGWDIAQDSNGQIVLHTGLMEQHIDEETFLIPCKEES